VDVRKPRWSSASYLLYLGAFTVLAAAGAAYAYLSSLYGDAAFVGWTLLMLAILLALAASFRSRGPWLAAGLFAYLSVAAFGTVVGALFTWWGWGGGSSNGSPFHGWHWVLWLLILIVLAVSLAALRAYRFPLLVLPIALLLWFLVTDIVSGGGSWSADWWLIVLSSVLFIAIGIATSRSSWAVIGSLGMFAAAVHFSIDWASGGAFGLPTKAWVPIVVAAVLGFVFVALGLWGWRRPQPAE
jgi:hypothetical protein